jgi:hypothetical protein
MKEKDENLVQIISRENRKNENLEEIEDYNRSLLNGYRFSLKELSQKEISKKFYYLVMYNNFITDFQEKRIDDSKEVDFVYFLFDWFIKYHSDEKDENEAKNIIIELYEFFKYLQNLGKFRTISLLKNLIYDSLILKERIDNFHRLDKEKEGYFEEFKSWTMDIYRIWDELEENYLYD